MNKIAKFNIGEVVIHRRTQYRAVIVDIDPLFQASGLYNPQAQKHEFATKNPWYRLLVDDSSQITYVEENMLMSDPSQEPITNPNIYHYFASEEGNYQSSRLKH